jgi:hypothetical protein
VADCLNNPLTANSLKQSISTYNVEVLKEIESLNLYDFGIFLEIEPDEEEKAQLEQNIQVSLQNGGIDLEDAIDIRQVRNLKLANQLLKLKRKKKLAQVQQQQLANIQAQADANSQNAEKAAMFEVQKQQALTQEAINVEQAKSQFEIQRLQTEAQIKKQLMAEQFNYDMQLAQLKVQADTNKFNQLEDRKDERTKIQASQQSELIDQRKNDSLPKDFQNNAENLMNDLGGMLQME